MLIRRHVTPVATRRQQQQQQQRPEFTASFILNTLKCRRTTLQHDPLPNISLPTMIDTLINIAFCLSTALTVLILLLPSQYVPNSSPDPKSTDSTKRKISVQILVLGDIGRSPRMQYHAISIAERGGQVALIGYHGIIPLTIGYYLLIVVHRIRYPSRCIVESQHIDRPPRSTSVRTTD